MTTMELPARLETKDGNWVLIRGDMAVPEQIPLCPGADIEIGGVYSCGKDSVELCLYRVAETEYAAYGEILARDGWARYAENAMAGNRFATYTNPNGRVLHGLGQIIYPSENKKEAPSSSLRFVMCRDAFEDYEYFLLAEKLIKKCKDPAKAAAARKLLKEAGDAIVPAYEAREDQHGWKKTKWETDGSKLLVWRKKIADLIESLQK